MVSRGVIQKRSSNITSESYRISQNIRNENLYWLTMSEGGNCCFVAFFGVLFLFYLLISIRSEYRWFCFCFISAFGLETLGYAARVASSNDYSSTVFYALQLACLLAAPTFIMAGIHHIFAQIVTVYGPKYSICLPRWYICILISTEAITFAIQCTGGILAGVSQGTSRAQPARMIMLSGNVLQMVAMSIFFCVFLEFLWRVFFQDRKYAQSGSDLRNMTLLNFLKMLLNVKSARTFKSDDLDCFYNHKFQGIRTRPLLGYYPLILLLCVLLLYTRCVYRLIELAQGNSGYLHTHEVFIFTLDSALIAICGCSFVIFHPDFVFGKQNVLQTRELKEECISSEFADIQFRHTPRWPLIEDSLDSHERVKPERQVSTLYIL